MLEDLELPKKVWPCRIRTVKADLSEKDSEILDKIVMNYEWPLRTLSNQLKKRGIDISDNSIKNHREKRCSCWKI
jgi:FixJ family two-component response regulator